MVYYVPALDILLQLSTVIPCAYIRWHISILASIFVSLFLFGWSRLARLATTGRTSCCACQSALVLPSGTKQIAPLTTRPQSLAMSEKEVLGLPAGQAVIHGSGKPCAVAFGQVCEC